MIFDLLHEPWLPAVDSAGEPCGVGLVQAFERAHELRWIDAEAPVVTAALHRLLLALAHRICGPEDNETWLDLWQRDTLPPEPLRKYADQYGDRFDLFGDRPFLQSPGIPDSKIGTAAQLTMYRSVGSNATLFDQTTAADHVVLDPAEAARWLVTVQAYDTGGTKTPLVADKSSERGPCNQFAAMLVEGATLKQTLLLNMPVYAPGYDLPKNTLDNDRPIWELDTPPGPEPLRTGRAPDGWTDVLTWPARRIRLRRAAGGAETAVDGAAVLPGTRLRAELHTVEQMAAFRRPARKGPRGRAVLGDYRPVQLEELRGVWRHCRELLLPADRQGTRVRPRVLDHIAEIAPWLPRDTVYGLRVFGQRLDPQGGAVHSWLQESVPMPVALLRADTDERRLEELLGYAVGLADDIGAELRDLERDYAAALGDSAAKRQHWLLEQWYWPELAAPFGVLLRDLGEVLAHSVPGESRARPCIELFDAWGGTVRATADRAQRRWVRDLPRAPSREVLELAAGDLAFCGRTRKLYQQYHLAVRSPWPPQEQQDGE
ncbi:type I-E CRISPR-associated protein Cse1/CasA [Streptomonospora sediminis]